MKIALVHDWLGPTRGGAEEVFLRIAKLYPQAEIYSLTYHPKTYPELTSRQVTTSWLGKLPSFIRRKTGLLTLFAPHAIEHLKLGDYDLVISSSNSFAKGVKTSPSSLHICYCYSPMRYVWDYWPQWRDERAHNFISKAYVTWLTHRLRLWDYSSSKRVDAWIAISKTVQQRLAKYYHVKSSLIYSAVIDTSRFWNPQATHHNYYVTLSTLTTYKKIDLAIKACLSTGRKLMVIGDGPQAAELKKLASGNSNIVFMGRVSEAEKIQYLQQARGLIFASQEDFGIAPLEAVAAGTPVIAYNQGGLRETIVAGKSGIFFDEPTTKSLIAALDKFEEKQWNPALCHDQSKPYDVKLFDRAFTKQVASIVKARRKNG